jgi:hypothetical protein
VAQPRRLGRHLSLAVAAVAMLALPASTLAKIDPVATACTITGGSASLDVAWKGRDPDSVLAAYYVDATSLVYDSVSPSSADLKANGFTMPLSGVPITAVTVGFLTAGGKTFDSVSVACAGG